jgi:predicted NUDIX family NTP pyrophosphohydrolase
MSFCLFLNQHELFALQGEGVALPLELDLLVISNFFQQVGEVLDFLFIHGIPSMWCDIRSVALFADPSIRVVSLWYDVGHSRHARRGSRERRWMTKQLSAGILLYRFQSGNLQVFLVHPGGPFWAQKDDEAWSIPKGEYHDGDDPLATAKREFREETGSEVTGLFRALSPLTQPSGKVVSAWAVKGDIDAASVKSNTFSLEWPPRSGKRSSAPKWIAVRGSICPPPARTCNQGSEAFSISCNSC